MYLKRIELNGFKSFAEKTILDFPESKEGRFVITSIVGPNGSGKSNISDAIRWVLGEQSLKQLRGKKSQDIIFSGSAIKSQLGMASVVLFFDNSDHRVPIDYDEFVVSRKIYRSGESAYLVNGKKIRLIDFQLLLAKAQFGNNSYGIISQGTIDQFLSHTPADRKLFLDEASGIKEFQIRRHQAILRLDQTKENIEQAELILSELEPRLRNLTNQVKKLEKRQEVEKELRDLFESYYTTLWQEGDKKTDEVNKEVESLSEILKEKEKELLDVQNNLAVLAREKTRVQIFEELEKQYQSVILEKNVLDSEIGELKAKLHSEYRKTGQQEVGWIKIRLDELKAKVHILGEEKITIEKELTKNKENAISKKLELQKIEANISALKEKLNSSRFTRMNSSEAVASILANKTKFGGVYGVLSELGETDEEFALALDVAAGSHLSSIVVEDDVVAEKCIEYLRAERLGIATFLPLNKIRPKFISNETYDLLGQNGVIGFALDLARFPKKFESAFAYVFGSTLIINTIENGRRIGVGKVRMVTLGGDLLEIGGSMRGGFRGKQKSAFSFAGGLDLKNNSVNFEKIEIELEQLRANYENIKTELVSCNFEIQILENKLGENHKKEIELQKEIRNLEEELSLSGLDGGDREEVFQKIQDRKTDCENRSAILDNELESLKLKMREFNNAEEEKRNKIFSLQDIMQERQTELNKLIDKMSLVKMELVKYQTKQEDLRAETISEVGDEIENILKRCSTTLDVSELESARANIQKLKYKLSLIGGIDETVEQEYKETSERHTELTTKLVDLKASINDLEKLICELDDLMKKKRSKMFKQIRDEFKKYFSLLFGGGEADLVEIYGEENQNEEIEGEQLEELNSAENKQKILVGVELVASPPGKKIKNINSLSGGERTMASIALICAILKANPSPFIILDEVEAALDEANSLRFTEILRDLAERSQCILITHNRATMHSSDVLYGVTMGGDGISRLMSVKLNS